MMRLYIVIFISFFILNAAANTEAERPAIIQAIVEQFGLEKQTKLDNASLVENLNHISNSYLQKGKYIDGSKIAEATTKFSEYALSSNHLQTLISYNNLALFYRTQGNHKEAENLLKFTLEKFINNLGVDHPLTLKIVNNLAELYENQGQYKKAGELLQSNLKYFESSLGLNHTTTLMAIGNLGKIYNSQGRYEEAEFLLKRAFQTSQNEFGKEHLLTLANSGNLALLYFNKGELEEAKYILEPTLETAIKILGERHPHTVIFASNLGNIYQEQGQLKRAEEIHKHILDISIKELGYEHPETLAIIGSLVTNYQVQGKYNEALQLGFENYHHLREKLGPDNPYTVNSATSLAQLYKSQGFYTESESLFKEYLEISISTLGENHSSTLMIKNNIALLYRAQGKYEEAEENLVDIFEKSSKYLGSDHPVTIMIIGNLAVTYRVQGKFKKAGPLYIKSINLSKKKFGENHPNTYTDMNNLAVFYEELGRTEEAEKIHLKILKGRRSFWGQESPRILSSLSNLGDLYRMQGRYREAEELYSQAQSILEKENYDIQSKFRVLHNLSLLYLSQGFYAKAEPLLLEVFHERRLIQGYSHPETISSLHNLAMLYRRRGQLQNVENMLLEAIETLKEKLGPNHIDVLNIMNSLSLVYGQMEEHNKAKKILHKIVTINTKNIGREHPDTLNAMSNLAIVYRKLGHAKKAENLFIEVLELKNKTLGKKHPETLSTLNNFAFFYDSIKEHDKAKSIFLKTLLYSIERLGNEHPETLNTHLNYINTLLKQEKPGIAFEHLEFFQDSVFSLIGREFNQEHNLNDKRSLLYEYNSFQNLSYQLALNSDSNRVKKFALNTLLRWQQVNLEQQLNLSKNIFSTKDPKAKKLTQELSANYKFLASTQSDPNANSESIISLLEEVESQEQQLSQHNTGFKENYLAIRDISVDHIPKSLNPNNGILILRMFWPFIKDWSDTPHWLAAWLTKDSQGELQYDFHDLGPIEPSHTLWQTTQTDPSPKASQALYQHLFKKLDKDFQKVDRIYFAADGFLQLDDISHWRLPDGRYWIERQDIRRLNVARDLLRKAPTTKGKGLITFGNIDYDQSNAPKAQQVANADDHVFRGSPYAKRALQEVMDENLQNGEFAALKDSAAEVDAIQRYYKKAYPNSNIQDFSGQTASEYPLKHLKTPPHVLHFATHAFYLEDTNYLQRPLLLSGLALANANKGRQGITGADGEDGILYALEATSLNLQGTELVTLSACETAQGEMDYTEGVYGLIQAFKVAGAKNILMTLKKVKDNDARVFMDAFYGRWLKTPGQHPAVALRETKLAFIHGQDKYQQKPGFWSPYVLVEVAQ